MGAAGTPIADGHFSSYRRARMTLCLRKGLRLHNRLWRPIVLSDQPAVDNLSDMGGANYPLAYLLTWTCYGTWLHGDDRGSVDVEHNVPHTPFLPPNVWLRAKEYHTLKHEPMLLNIDARRVVGETIQEHGGIRGWEMLATNVRSNHVHVVARLYETHPREAMRQLKYWTTRRLKERRCIRSDARVWTNHGSTRFLWTETSVVNAINYVNEYQGDELK